MNLFIDCLFQKNIEMRELSKHEIEKVSEGIAEMSLVFI